MNDLPTPSMWNFLKQQFASLSRGAKTIVYFIVLTFFLLTSGLGYGLKVYLTAVEREAFRVGFLSGVVTDRGSLAEVSPDELKRRGIRISTKAKAEAVRAFYDNEEHAFAIFSSRLDIPDAVVQFIAEGLDPQDPTKETTKAIDLKNWLLDRRRKLVLVPRLNLDKREFELKIEKHQAERRPLPALIALRSQGGSFGVSWAAETRAPVTAPVGEPAFTRALFEVVSIKSSQRVVQQAAPDFGVYLELELDGGIKKRLPREGRIFLAGEKRFIGLATGIPWPAPQGGESVKIWIVSVEKHSRQDLTVRLTVPQGLEQTVEQAGLRLTYRISGPYHLSTEIDRLGSPDRTVRERSASIIAIVFREDAIEPLWKAITYARSVEKDMAIISTLKQIPCRSGSQLERTTMDRLLYTTPAYRNQRDYNRIWEAVIRKPNCT